MDSFINRIITSLFELLNDLFGCVILTLKVFDYHEYAYQNETNSL